MRAAIVLAAGASRRFGHADKLFAMLRGKPLVLHAIGKARGAPVGRVIVVADRVSRIRMLIRSARLEGVTVVRPRGRDRPLSATLRAGLAALRPIERDVFVFLGDMPATDSTMPRRLIRAGRGGRSLVRPRFGETPGHPVLARNVRQIALGQGDRGFRPDPARVAWVAGGAASIADVDRRRDLRHARLRGGALRLR